MRCDDPIWYCAFWTDVRRPRWEQVAQVLCELDVHGELPGAETQCANCVGVPLGFDLQLQVRRIVFLPYVVVPRVDPRYGWDESSGMRGLVHWECVVLEPAGIHIDDHVHHGSCAVLPGHVPLVYHLEHGIQHWTVIHARLSIWTPWREIFTMLPKRIYAKILATADMEVKYKPKVLISQIWNAVTISMYREHLPSIDHVQNLLYHQVTLDGELARCALRAPAFFISQGNRGSKGKFFPADSKAEHRISFFAQSSTTAILEALLVDAMLMFMVLMPHYSEKVSYFSVSCVCCDVLEIWGYKTHC